MPLAQCHSACAETMRSYASSGTNATAASAQSCGRASAPRHPNRATAHAATGIAAVTATGFARKATASSSAAGHQPRHDARVPTVRRRGTIHRAHAYSAQVVKNTIAVSGMKVWL